MSPLAIALRRKFRRPADAIKALGLDPRLVEIPRLALDSKLNSDPAALRVKLEKLLAANLTGHELQQAREMLENHLGGNEYDFAHSKQDGFDDEPEPDDDERRAMRKMMMGKVADFLSKEKGMDEKEIAEYLRDFPANGLEHLGGALDDDLTELMQSRGKKMAGDSRRRQPAQDSFLQMFPEAARLTGTALEGGISMTQESPIGGAGGVTMDSAAYYRKAVGDSASLDSFERMFPESTRIRNG